MRTSVQAIIGLVLVLIVVIGVYAAVSGVLNNAGDGIGEGGEGSGTKLECVLGNPSQADDECREDTSLEVTEKDVIQV